LRKTKVTAATDVSLNLIWPVCTSYAVAQPMHPMFVKMLEQPHFSILFLT